MTGASGDYKNRGVIPRMVSSLFQEISMRYQQDIQVGVSYLQLYNQSLIDLLAPIEGVESPLSIQEDARGYIQVKGQIVKRCQNQEEAQAVLFEGLSQRITAQHKLNLNSSRSHCIFTIHLSIRSKVQSLQKVIMSKISLVDLAGSQRTKKTGSEGKMLVEAQFINKSLSFLEQVVMALSEKKRDHIPYRQNKLTYLLKDCIGGNSITILIANIWPEISHIQQTISTLKFATRMMKVSNETSLQIALDPQVLIRKYQKDIKDLRQELAMHDTLSNRGRITYQPYPPQKQFEMQKIAKDFLDGKTQDIDVQSLRQVKQLFFQFRNLYRNMSKDIVNKIPAQQVNRPTQEKKKQSTKAVDKVGTEDSKLGFGIGKAGKDSKPNINIENLVNVPKQQFKEGQTEQQNKPVEPQSNGFQNRIVKVDRAQAYLQFKDSAGQELSTRILKNGQELNEKKNIKKQKSLQLQQLKKKIDQVNMQLTKKEENKTQDQITQGIIDQEEFQLLKQKKQFNKQYKMEAQSIKTLHSQINDIKQNIQLCKQNLVTKFEQWFKKKYSIQLKDIDNPLINQRKLQDEDAQQTVQDNIDQDALAYIAARKKVVQLQKARKQVNKI